MSEPVLVVRARRLRAARGVVVARDVTLEAAPGDVVAVEVVGSSVGVWVVGPLLGRSGRL